MFEGTRIELPPELMATTTSFGGGAPTGRCRDSPIVNSSGLSLVVLARSGYEIAQGPLTDCGIASVADVDCDPSA